MLSLLDCLYRTVPASDVAVGTMGVLMSLLAVGRVFLFRRYRERGWGSAAVIQSSHQHRLHDRPRNSVACRRWCRWGSRCWRDRLSVCKRRDGMRRKKRFALKAALTRIHRGWFQRVRVKVRRGGFGAKRVSVVGLATMVQEKDRAQIGQQLNRAMGKWLRFSFM